MTSKVIIKVKNIIHFLILNWFMQKYRNFQDSNDKDDALMECSVVLRNFKILEANFKQL